MRAMMVALRLLLIAATLLVCGGALAQSNTDRAREMGEKGVALYDEEKYAQALDLLIRAEELHHAPTLRLYIARCYDKLGRLREALAQYREILAEELPEDAPDQFRESREAAHAEVDLLIPRIPTVVVQPEGAPLETITVKVNGKVVPAVQWPKLEIDPGEHTFEAEAQGYAPSTKNVIVPEGARTEVVLTVTPIRPAAPPIVPEAPLPMWPAYVGVGVGGAGLIAGIVTGALHLSKVRDLESRCRPDDRCPASDADDAATAQTFATVSTITFIVGGTLAAAGIAYGIVVLTSDDGTATARLGPYGGSLTLRF